MTRLVKECEDFFSEWQAGFRADRGCRDNILILRLLYHAIVNGEISCIVTYIDYKAAFDTVSHKFLDATLARAKAKRKSRAMFRAIYSVATGKARVQGTLGEIILSRSFDL